jgi:hypothetical protein
MGSGCGRSFMRKVEEVRKFEWSSAIWRCQNSGLSPEGAGNKVSLSLMVRRGSMEG